MNYYYDIILNFFANSYSFYEWYDTDKLNLIKKIPIYKVKKSTYIFMISNDFTVGESFLKEIANKTLVADKAWYDYTYACLITDGKNSTAFLFDSDGKMFKKSTMLIQDELNISEIAYTIKEKEIDFTINKPSVSPKELRILKEAHETINKEVEKLYNNHDVLKLKYLYYEYKKKTESDLDKIYLELTNLKKDEDIIKMNDIIKLTSYNV